MRCFASCCTLAAASSLSARGQYVGIEPEQSLLINDRYGGVRQQPPAGDHLFDQVQRQVEVLAGGFKADPRILPCKSEELASQTDLGLQAARGFNPQTMAFFGWNFLSMPRRRDIFSEDAT